MKPILTEVKTEHTPRSLVRALGPGRGLVLLESALRDERQGRYSLIAAAPFLTLVSRGARCEITTDQEQRVVYGNPWRLLETLMGRYELLEQVDLPFPLGGVFGCWGYELKNFVEPQLPAAAVNDLETPDCHLGFYDSLVVFDQSLGKTWVVSTGLAPDGDRSAVRARNRARWWIERLRDVLPPAEGTVGIEREVAASSALPELGSNLSRQGFISRVIQAKQYIRAGDIYQVNLSHRLSWPETVGGWELYNALAVASPASFAAYLHGGDFELVTSSPELFLRMSARQVHTRPIKGTRPRSSDPTRDAQLAYELQTSAKEQAELVMIVDLLRNDLGRICDFGSVQVPELMRLERYAQVQHLVGTVEGRLRPDVSHPRALSQCFPGGSITGAPKIRALEIIDELEPISRGPYTGCMGYLGFNRESQLNIVIRTALCTLGRTWFHVGAGIVADSDPAAEYDETMTKANGFLRALTLLPRTERSPSDRPDRVGRPGGPAERSA